MNRSGFDFLLGLTAGASLGAVIALLYAPDTGKNTRDRLSFRLQAYIEDLRESVDRLKEKQQEITSKAKEEGNKVVRDAQARADQLIQEAESLLENIEKTNLS